MESGEGESRDASAGRKRPGIGARRKEERMNAIRPSGGKKIKNKKISLPKTVSK